MPEPKPRTRPAEVMNTTDMAEVLCGIAEVQEAISCRMLEHLTDKARLELAEELASDLRKVIRCMLTPIGHKS